MGAPDLDLSDYGRQRKTQFVVRISSFNCDGQFQMTTDACNMQRTLDEVIAKGLSFLKLFPSLELLS